MFIDTHTHLYSEQFDQDIDEVLQRAIEKKIDKFLLPSIDSSYTNRMLALEQKKPNNCFAMMGLHPCSVNQSFQKELDFVEEWLEKRDFIAIGEIGIDLYWDKTFFKQQQIAFQKQIQWAKEKNLPIVIHCRDAFGEIFEILEQEKNENLKGVFHCFTGNIEQAKKAIGYNLKLGIGGVVTFKNGGLDKFLYEIDLEHIVLETDSPYLAPTPYRGKRNESSYLYQVAKKISEIYQLEIYEVAKITSQNAKSIFSLGV